MSEIMDGSGVFFGWLLVFLLASFVGGFGDE